MARVEAPWLEFSDDEPGHSHGKRNAPPGHRSIARLAAGFVMLHHPPQPLWIVRART